MKICTYNILEGGVGRIDPLAEVVRLSGADAVVVEEAWEAGLFEKLADRLGMDCFLAENPHNREGATGLMTRWRIREAVNYAPLDRRITRSAFHATIGSGDAELTIVGLHLHAKETEADERIRRGEIAAILEIGERLGRPHVLAGDFNASHPEQRIDLEKLRPKSREQIRGQGDRVPREVITAVLAHGYVDAHALHRGPEAFDVSMTTSHPGMRVDYVFVRQELAGRVRGCEVFKPEMARFASDHYPVVAELEL